MAVITVVLKNWSTDFYPILLFLLLLFWFVGFGADGYYGMKFVVGAKVMDMKAYAGCEPYGGVSVWGELGIGLLLYGKLRLEGNIMDMGFPTTAEIEFKKFPLDVQLVVKLISKIFSGFFFLFHVFYVLSLNQ